MNPETFSDLAASRHSVRDFRTDPVPPEVIEEILEDARQALALTRKASFPGSAKAQRLPASRVQPAPDRGPGLSNRERGMER